MKQRKENKDFLGGFLSGAESPHVAEKAKSAVQAAEEEGELPVLPLKARPRGPAQKGAFKRVHR